MLAWGARVSPRFRALVAEIAARGGFEASWLMACMAFETGGTFSSATRNAVSGATGLIQNMPQFAVGDVGYTVEQIAAMTPEEALERVVARYFAPFAGRIQSLSDCYMAILWKRAVGQPDDSALFGEGTKAYLQNRGLDVNADGTITKGEATAKVARLLEQGLLPGNAADLDTQPAAPIVDADPAHRINIEAENTMGEPQFTIGGTLKSLAGPASLFNPLIGAALGAAGGLIDFFSPLVKEKFVKELGRHDIAPEIAGQMGDALLQAAKGLTKQDDDWAAVAAARKDPTIMAQLESVGLQKLSDLAPVLEQAQRFQREAWDAEEASKAAAAIRNQQSTSVIADKLADRAFYTYWTVVVAMGVILGLQICLSGDHKPNDMLLGAFVVLISSGAKHLETVFGYVFGTSRSSAAKDAIIGEISARRRG